MAKGSVNKAIILGRLGQDPDIRATASGTQVANLSIATTEIGAKDQNGQRQESTEWHRATAFGRTAEIAGQYLQKGSQVYIEGRLQTRKWQDQNGQDRYSTEIVVSEMQFIGGKSDNSAMTHDASQNAYQKPQQHQPAHGFQQQPQQQQYHNQAPQGFTGQPAQSQQFQQQPAPSGFEDFEDDIPFNGAQV